jgi:hypothetical protein
MFKLNPSSNISTIFSAQIWGKNCSENLLNIFFFKLNVARLNKFDFSKVPSCDTFCKSCYHISGHSVHRGVPKMAYLLTVHYGVEEIIYRKRQKNVKKILLDLFADLAVFESGT